VTLVALVPDDWGIPDHEEGGDESMRVVAIDDREFGRRGLGASIPRRGVSGGKVQ
jgi:hypothetical protein